MASVEGVRRNETDTNSMYGEKFTRKVSEDVASLDSWTDALNVSTSSDSSFHFLSDENRRGPGSGFKGGSVSTNIDRRRHFSHPDEEESLSSSPGLSTMNYDVIDGGNVNPYHGINNAPHRQLNQSSGVHINHSNSPGHVWHTNHTQSNFTKPEDPRTENRGALSWFNDIRRNVTSQPTQHAQQHYRPHAFSTSSADTRNITRFGISAQSRLGLPQTNIPNSNRSGNIPTRSQSQPSRSSDFGSPDTISDHLDRESERIKTKFMSAWNNVKYGWTLKTKTNFKYDSPIFLLGKCYHRKGGQEIPDETEMHRTTEHRVSSLDEFHQDFSSRMWFTYRREFTALPGTKLTTDCGWGCMLRSGQMLMAQALVNHFLGRDWRVFDDQKPEHKAYYKEIIRWFGDQLSDQIPFSIHKLVEIGVKHGKDPGDWYGPASVSLILRDALTKAYSSLPVLKDVCVYVAQDCTVYKQDIIDLCLTRPKSSSQNGETDEAAEDNAATNSKTWKRSVIVLVPMRLGGECLNPIYIPCVKSLLAYDNCIGIIGGKPKHSLYFVGWQEDKLIDLDPHYCQDLVDTSVHDFPVQTFHCVSPRKMPVSKMDPSCTVGFYIKSEEDFNKFVRAVGEMVNPPRQKGLYPLFIFSEGRGSDSHWDENSGREKGRLKIRHYRVDNQGNVRSPTIESEDFVIL